jgi:MSHA biogenesis protein MshJ
MKEQWARLVKRFDALGKRERTTVLLGGVLVIALVGFSLIDSALGKQRAFEKQITQARADQAMARAQIDSLTRQLAQDPDAVVRRQMAELRSEIEKIDAEVKGVHRGLVSPERMAGVLESMLTRNRRVELVALKTLPASALVELADAADAERNVFKHGIELTLEGGYLDLLDYLARLERLPWQMFWAKAEMDAAGYPRVRLTVTVYTLSLDRKWLVV